jgi:hypothetical protein
MRNTAEVTGGKPIAVLLQSISGVSAINPFAFYDIHGRKRELLFCFVPDTTRDGMFYQNDLAMMNTADETGISSSLSDCTLLQVLLIPLSPFTSSVKVRARSYSFTLSRTRPIYNVFGTYPNKPKPTHVKRCI